MPSGKWILPTEQQPAEGVHVIVIAGKRTSDVTADFLATTGHREKGKWVAHEESLIGWTVELWTPQPQFGEEMPQLPDSW
jgi:hypothetical protein